jgi:hypothetical protein
MGKYGRSGRTHEDFIRDLGELKPNIEVTSRYKSYRKPVEVRCKVDGTRWKATPRLLMYRTKGACPTCRARKIARTLRIKGQQKIDAKIAAKFGGRIRRVGPYIDALTPTRFVCDEGHDILRGPKFVLGTASGCEICGKRKGGLKTRKSIDAVIESLEGRNIDYVSGYKMRTAKCKFRCRVCKNTWKTFPYSIIKGYGCPHCAAALTKNTVTTKWVALGKRRVKVMGWEHHALRWLTRRVRPNLITVASEKTVPVIRYRGVDGQTHRHYPDMYIKRRNLILEVKSTWTIGLVRQDSRAFKTLQLKSLAAKRAGYRYAVLLMMPTRRIKLPEEWESMSFRDFRKWAIGKKLLADRHISSSDIRSSSH